LPINLSKAGWSWGCVSVIDSEGRTIWIVDAHRDGKRFVVRADEKLSAFVELERKASKKLRDQPPRPACKPRALLSPAATKVPRVGVRGGGVFCTLSGAGLVSRLGIRLSLPDVRVEDEFEVCTELGVGLLCLLA
jgi:hypothetical protein